jgi:hypothetical protein
MLKLKERGIMNNGKNLTKGRHNLTISPDIWSILSELKKIRNQSIGEIIEDAVKKLIKDEKLNTTYFKIMRSAQFCDPKENEEITRILDNLTEDDLEISSEYELHYKTH